MTNIEKNLRTNIRRLSKWAASAAMKIDELQNQVARQRAQPEPAPRKAAAPMARPTDAARKGRAAVVCWDLGHNPAGRAVVLHDLLAQDWDVELVGPLWSRFGGEVWEPIADSGRRIRTFPCQTLDDFFPAALTFAEMSDYDLVVICKPRLPGLLLGAMLKRKTGCPIILDIDDFELSFFTDENSATLDELADNPDALIEPYEELATRASDSLIGDIDSRIVSNVALQDRFGGRIVRHARDESHFKPGMFDRGAYRARLGIPADQFAIIFVGTPRPHKGVTHIADTLEALNDDRFALHIVGDIRDARDRKRFESYSKANIVMHPGCKFDELPGYIAAADAVVLLQDPDHPISRFQIPAKISDATAFGLPTIVSDVPPIADLVDGDLLQLVAPDELGATLKTLIAQRDDGELAQIQSRIRLGFARELSFCVNRERLNVAIDIAQAAPAELPASFDRMIEIVTDAYAARRRPASVPARPAAASDEGDAKQIDIAMFWKQNDSRLYGRRSDMLMKHLLKTGYVRRVIQFDAPMELTTLARTVERDTNPLSPSRRILANICDNHFDIADTEDHRYRTYIWDAEHQDGSSISDGVSLADYPAYVLEQMQHAGMDPENTLAWVCPVVFDFPAITSAVPFKGIVGDLIDDQRAFDGRPEHLRRIESNYEAVLPMLDLTLTNCEPIASAFKPLAGTIHVVPNGTEIAETEEDAPEKLIGIKRPIAGYVGNLRDRIDWSLLEQTAKKLPDVSFVVIGAGARPEDIAAISKLDNVCFLGAVPYDDVQGYIQAFDVALLPHISSDLTARMNPLKIYNYFAAKKPIVATRVANIDPDVEPFIRFGSDADDYAAQIENACENGLADSAAYADALGNITWTRRADQIIDILKSEFAAN